MVWQSYHTTTRGRSQELKCTSCGGNLFKIEYPVRSVLGFLEVLPVVEGETFYHLRAYFPVSSLTEAKCYFCGATLGGDGDGD